MKNKLANKKGVGQIALAVIISTVISLAIAFSTNWYISLNKNTKITADKMAQMSIAYNKWQNLINGDYDEQVLKLNTEEKETIGDYEITTFYKDEGSVGSNGECSISVPTTIKNNRCMTVTISVNGKDGSGTSQPYSLTANRIASQTNSYSKEKVEEMLKKYVMNGSFDDTTNTGLLSLSIGNDGNEEQNKKLLHAKLDGIDISLAPSIDMLGKPDWDNAYKISFPFLAPEDGYIWVHLGGNVVGHYYALTLITPSGQSRGHLMCYDWGGSNFMPVNKGDRIVYENYQSRVDMEYFVPFKKEK